MRKYEVGNLIDQEIERQAQRYKALHDTLNNITESNGALIETVWRKSCEADEKLVHLNAMRDEYVAMVDELDRLQRSEYAYDLLFDNKRIAGLNELELAALAAKTMSQRFCDTVDVVSAYTGEVLMSYDTGDCKGIDADVLRAFDSVHAERKEW